MFNMTPKKDYAHFTEAPGTQLKRATCASSFDD